jgi:Fe-S cluster biogenesis protein NfuA
MDQVIKDKIKQKLDEIKPILQRDGGDLELVEITDEGIVKIRLMGMCAHCAMSTMTVKMGVEEFLKKSVPEVKSVESV